MSVGPLAGAGRAALRASVAAYRVALRRYPADLRRRYGASMVACFEESARRALDERGLRGLGAVWWRTGRDLLHPLPGEIQVDAGRGAMRRAGDVGWITGLRVDLGFALRSLVREPRFAALVVLVLATGIALNTATFAVLNAYVLRPLPFPEPDRLVSVQGGESIAWTEVEDVFDRAVSWDLDMFTIIGDGPPEAAPGAWVTPDFLDMYGVRAEVGRTFRRDEAGQGGAPVAMISHRLWQERFGGRPDVVGRAFSAFTSDRPDHAELFTIVGVLPADFWYLNDYTDVLTPIRVDRALYTGRLRADVPIDRAESMLREIAIRSMDEVPPDFRVELIPLQELHAAAVRPTLVAMQVAVLIVLLIACANAAVLLLIRSARRQRELGVRRALGAPTHRLASQLLLEGGLLSVAAGGLGVVLAAWALHLGRATVELRLGRSVPGGAEALSIDGTVLLLTVALAAMVGIAFGVVPLLTSLRGALSPVLGDGSRGGSESRSRRRIRALMVAAEVAASLSLLIGAGLMVRSAVNLQRQELGFDPEGILRVVVGLREASYPTAADRVDIFMRMRERVARIPGVERVGLVSSGVFTTRFNPESVEGGPNGVIERAEGVDWLVGDGYFETLRIPLLRGRTFGPDDVAGADPVAVVSESLARDLWGDGDPIGRAVRVPPMAFPGMPVSEPGPWMRVVGVVGDVQREIGGAPVGDLYGSYRQAEPRWMNLMVRNGSGSPVDLAAVEAAIHGLDPDVPVTSVVRLDDAVASARRPTRDIAGLLIGFSAFALLLAVLGLYGVVSYAARQRRRDVAIRMALGADRDAVISLFLRQGAVVVVSGIVLGTLGGYLLGRTLEGQLYGVRAGDVATHVALAAMLALTALFAVWLPARHAAGAKPMGVLREE